MSLDFEEYRRCYYWFQFHFFLRGTHSKSGRLSNFLWQLIMHEDDVHRRWSVTGGMTTQPKAQIRRVPRGMKKADAIKIEQARLDAMPEKSYSHVAMGRQPERESLRCRFMLKDYLRSKNGHVWNNFASLYRALIIFDLIDSGNTVDDVIQMHFSSYELEDFYLRQMTDKRTPLPYEFLATFFKLGSLNSLFEPLPQTTGVFLYTCDSIELLKVKIVRHFNFAKELIDLAVTGNFSRLPSIKAPKH